MFCKKNMDVITRHYSIKKNMRLHQSAIYIFASVCHPLLLWKCSSLIILPQLAPGCCKEENDLQPVSLFYHFGWLYLPCNTETSCLDTINRNFPRKKTYIYIYTRQLHLPSNGSRLDPKCKKATYKDQ